MSKVQFEVSAKTARLIGRENISDVDGAVIELIKNSYDADATCVQVTLDIPFPSVPRKISYELCNLVFDTDEMAHLLFFYTDANTHLEKKTNLSAKQDEELCAFLNSKNHIIVMDNGSGMTEHILRNAWMNIGTSDKEERRVSEGGRVKTGAKGIGRFALDKLSTATTVITKHKKDSLKEWHIDWEQFETASLLQEVTATIDECNGIFFEYAKKIAGTRFKAFLNYNWETGTIIKLSPTRENWSETYFSKLNKNLRSLFPSTNESQFDIYVNNIFYPKYSFTNERFSLNTSEYDYKIIGSFDGLDTLDVEIFRNEIDTRKLKTTIKVANKSIDLPLSEFWNRKAFANVPYLRSSFSKTIRKKYSVASLTKIDSSIIESVGPFSVELYFLKNASSSIEIVKPVVSARRKEILSKFSGIKLYRDGFKVRPYGEEDGPSFDWLSLGVRAQKSPAAVSHQNGSWRVRSNQIIGAVRISKDDNPNLSDMANREGLALNDSFVAFKTIIDKILESFEYDRQYIFREYAAWIKAKEKELSNSERIIASAKKNSNLQQNQNGSNETKLNFVSSETDAYSKSEYERTILELEEKRKSQERATKTMMLYSSAGVMTNTFSHEISRIMTQAGSRMQHLRFTVEKLVGKEGYQGHPSYNPFPIIDQAESVDNLLENWLAVIMSGVGENVFSKQEIDIPKTFRKYITIWKPLLEKKLISVNPLKVYGNEENCVCNISEVDLLIIINNFMLNSSYFLTKSNVSKRIVEITIKEAESQIIIELENNGLPIDGIFANNPDRIFEAGVSTKETEDGKGSGIGLWITQTLVLDNSGEIHPMVKQDGFGLKISFPK